MNEAVTQVILHCGSARAFAILQEWQNARNALAKAATYLLPAELERQQGSTDAVDPYQILQDATRDVAKRYLAAFPPATNEGA